MAAMIAAQEAAASPVIDVSKTQGRAEGEETIAFNPADPKNIILGSNQWQPRPHGGYAPSEMVKPGKGST